MIRIGRLRVEIITAEKVIGFDDTFDQNMNIICSELNTSGKSSIISSIYYGLGLEEIIGGRGYKVMSSAFKNKVEYNTEELDVLESKVFLEISNGTEYITILRTAKMENRDSNLMTIYYSRMDYIQAKDTESEDMYVHSPNSAISSKGFFTFLESFLGLNLPNVPSTDDKERKLYLQLIFSSMLIEQKRGWADLFSGMPHLGIREPKKRVIEYLLNMDTLKNEKLKYELKINGNRITEKWKRIYYEIVNKLEDMNLILKGVTEKAEILNEPRKSIMAVYQSEDSILTLDEYIELKKHEYQNLIKVKPKNIESFQELKVELKKIEEDIIEHETKIKQLRNRLSNEKSSLDKLSSSLKLIQTDIFNNQDAKKLRNLGSKEGFNSFKDICPTCNQTISDSLLVSQNVTDIMGIEENIKHLKTQEKLFEYAIVQKKGNIKEIETNIHVLENTISKMYQLARVTRNDIFTIDGVVSEATIYKKVELNRTIDELEEMKNIMFNTINEFEDLSDDWKKQLANLQKLPKDKFTSLDEKKIKLLRNNFVSNLKTFGYRSSSNINKVMISKDSYMPIIENFDLKFDSSASDHIRRIWAFTIALVQTSNKMNGNHPGILIFDEPGQHSIVVEDMEAFLDCLIQLAARSQVIIGITIKETDTRELIFRKIADGSKGIIINDRAFSELDS